jgi:hypothetical protein
MIRMMKLERFLFVFKQQRRDKLSHARRPPARRAPRSVLLIQRAKIRASNAKLRTYSQA